MIYEYPSLEDPLRQGDIFFGLPRIEFPPFHSIPITTNSNTPMLKDWESIAEEGDPVAAILPIIPVAAIILSQNCDASRASDITLCEIKPFKEVEKKSEKTEKPNKWVSIITQQARLNQKWFYLPPDPQIGFKIKMGVDFHITLRIPRIELEELRHLRKGMLNDVASDHFRERIAEFFRRYPYNEWYPLDSEEMQYYIKDYPDAEPYSWQISKDDSDE